MKDKEFKDFDKEPEVTYLVMGQHPYKNDKFWSDSMQCNSFDMAIKIVDVFSEDYHDVYITKQSEYIYKMS